MSIFALKIFNALCILYCIYIANEINDESHYINNLVNWITSDPNSYNYKEFKKPDIYNKLIHLRKWRLEIIKKLNWDVHSRMDVINKIISSEPNHWIWNRRRCLVHQGRQMKKAQLELRENRMIFNWILNNGDKFNFPCPIEECLKKYIFKTMIILKVIFTVLRIFLSSGNPNKAIGFHPSLQQKAEKRENENKSTGPCPKKHKFETCFSSKFKCALHFDENSSDSQIPSNDKVSAWLSMEVTNISDNSDLHL